MFAAPSLDLLQFALPKALIAARSWADSEPLRQCPGRHLKSLLLAEFCHPHLLGDMKRGNREFWFHISKVGRLDHETSWHKSSCQGFLPLPLPARANNCCSNWWQMAEERTLKSKSKAWRQKMAIHGFVINYSLWLYLKWNPTNTVESRKLPC